MAARSYLQRIATPLAGVSLMLRPSSAPDASPLDPAPLRAASSPIRAETPRRSSEPLSRVTTSASEPAQPSPDLADPAAAEPVETPTPHPAPPAPPAPAAMPQQLDRPAAAARDHASPPPERDAPAPRLAPAAAVPPAPHDTQSPHDTQIPPDARTPPDALPRAAPRPPADPRPNRRSAPLAEPAPVARAETPPPGAPVGPTPSTRPESGTPAFVRRNSPHEPQVRIGAVEVRTSPVAATQPMIAPAPRAAPQATSRLSSGLGWRYSLHQS